MQFFYFFYFFIVSPEFIRDMGASDRLSIRGTRTKTIDLIIYGINSLTATCWVNWLYVLKYNCCISSYKSNPSKQRKQNCNVAPFWKQRKQVGWGSPNINFPINQVQSPTLIKRIPVQFLVPSETIQNGGTRPCPSPFFGSSSTCDREEKKENKGPRKRDR